MGSISKQHDSPPVGDSVEEALQEEILFWCRLIEKRSGHLPDRIWAALAHAQHKLIRYREGGVRRKN